MDNLNNDARKCSRCKKVLSNDEFKLKTVNEYLKRCISCNEKAKAMPSRSKEANKLRYLQDREYGLLKNKQYRENSPEVTCECGATVKQYTTIPLHLFSKTLIIVFLATPKPPPVKCLKSLVIF